jgi:ABC-type multidrug transport system ATPase subunit
VTGHVEVDALTARQAPYALGPVTASFGAGVHALVGARHDGVGVLLAAIADRTRVRSGGVRILGGSAGDPAIARAVAYVPLEPVLPEVLRVREMLELAADVRREPAMDPRARLEVLGIADLGERVVRTLRPEEARAVALCEALTSLARVVLLDEPYARIESRAATNLASAVSARAADGACVLVATASLREAVSMATDVLVFDKGALARRAAPDAALLARTSGPARFRIKSSDARALLAALAGDEAIAALEADPNGIVAAGPDAVQVAQAIARAAVRAGVEIESMRAEAPTLEELRASLAGDAAAAFEVARMRALRAAETQDADGGAS